jgi:hypothetical protein
MPPKIVIHAQPPKELPSVTANRLAPLERGVSFVVLLLSSATLLTLLFATVVALLGLEYLNALSWRELSAYTQTAGPGFAAAALWALATASACRYERAPNARHRVGFRMLAVMFAMAGGTLSWVALTGPAL